MNMTDHQMIECHTARSVGIFTETLAMKTVSALWLQKLLTFDKKMHQGQHVSC